MQEVLKNRFNQPLPPYASRRIVVWYDEAREFLNQLEESVPQGVRLLKMDDNSTFELRRQIELDCKDDNILLYCPLVFDKPDDNWLRDVFLYSEEFRADYWSLLFDELGIANIPSMREYAKTLAGFFKTKKNRRKLAAMKHSFVTERELRDAVFSACCGLETCDFSGVLRAVLSHDLYDENNPHTAAIDEGCGEGAFWRVVEDAYGFMARRSTHLLAAHLLAGAASLAVGGAMFTGMPVSEAKATACYAFFNEWLREDRPSLLRVCRQVEDEHNIPDKLSHTGRDSLMRLTVFPCVDRILLSSPLQAFASSAFRADDARLLIAARRDKPWHDLTKDYWDVLAQIVEMAEFHQAYRDGFHFTTPDEVWQAYAKDLYRMDAAYRKFYTAYDAALNAGIESLEDDLKAAAQTVDLLYKNWFLDEINTRWSELVYGCIYPAWHLEKTPQQSSFYTNNVDLNKRTFVIVSDALRYEVAMELCDRLNASLTGTADCSSVQGTFPTVTFMGMAALLPHRKLTLTDDLRVLVDGMPTDSLPDRQAVLQAKCPESAALTYDHFRVMNRSQRAELLKGLKVIYIYHNAIDAVGDHAATEKDVFEACSDCIEEICRLASTLVNELGAAAILITADHGFLYSHHPLEEMDKAERDLIHGEILQYKRRYALARGADPAYETLSVTMEAFGQPGIIAVTPRANLRFKLQGPGLNYVHGGLSLQELMVPVIHYQHRRAGSKGYKKADKVEVALLGDSRKVSNSVFNLIFFQKVAVSPKAQPRTVEAHFEDEAGKIVSDRQKIVADRENPSDSERTYRVTFHLTRIAFDSKKQYYLVMTDEEDNVELQKIPFVIDIAFGLDFGLN